ncbi:hypothetical protein ACQ4PT_029035 [Festuca glaucescens]
MQGHAELHNYALSHLNSLAIRCAVVIDIPNTFDRHGRATIILDIITKTELHAVKLSCLRQFMHVLIHSGIFDESLHVGESHTVYTFTLASSSMTMTQFPATCYLFTHPDTMLSTFISLEEWFRDPAANALFEIAHDMFP